MLRSGSPEPGSYISAFGEFSISILHCRYRAMRCIEVGETAPHQPYRCHTNFILTFQPPQVTPRPQSLHTSDSSGSALPLLDLVQHRPSSLANGLSFLCSSASCPWARPLWTTIAVPTCAASAPDRGNPAEYRNNSRQPSPVHQVFHLADRSSCRIVGPGPVGTSSNPGSSLNQCVSKLAPPIAHSWTTLFAPNISAGSADANQRPRAPLAHPWRKQQPSGSRDATSHVRLALTITTATHLILGRYHKLESASGTLHRQPPNSVAWAMSGPLFPAPR